MRRAGLLIVGAVLLVVVAVVVAFLSVDTRRETSIPFGDVPEGVSLRVLGRTPVFLVRSGHHIAALVGRSTHLRERLHWCVAEHVFHDPRIGGDVYDVRGRKVPGSGPAPRDLDSKATRIEGGMLMIRTNPLVVGKDVAHGGGRGVITPEWERAVAAGNACDRALPPF